MGMTTATDRATWVLPLLVTDGDCGFCQASAAWATRVIRGMPEVTTWQALDRAGLLRGGDAGGRSEPSDRKSTRLNSSHT